MSDLLTRAAAVYDDWRVNSPDSPPLAVRVILRGGVEFLLTGLMVSRDSDGESRMVGGEDAAFPVAVVVASEVTAVEFSHAEYAPQFGFAAR